MKVMLSAGLICAEPAAQPDASCEPPQGGSWVMESL